MIDTTGWTLKKLLINAMDLLEGLDDAQADYIEDTLIIKLKAAYCAERGHDVVPDHCRKSEHDYCITCGERRPGEAKRG